MKSLLTYLPLYTTLIPAVAEIDSKRSGLWEQRTRTQKWKQLKYRCFLDQTSFFRTIRSFSVCLFAVVVVFFLLFFFFFFFFFFVCVFCFLLLLLLLLLLLFFFLFVFLCVCVFFFFFFFFFFFLFLFLETRDEITKYGLDVREFSSISGNSCPSQICSKSISSYTYLYFTNRTFKGTMKKKKTKKKHFCYIVLWSLQRKIDLLVLLQLSGKNRSLRCFIRVNMIY